MFLANPAATAIVPALARSPHIIVPVPLNDDSVPLRFDVGGEKPFAVVFDHYRLSAATETAWRGTGARIVVIDDLADRPHDCDFLVDPSYGRSRQNFEGLVPPSAEALIGSDYALLRPEFVDARPFALERRDGRPVKRLLISTGLSDVGGLSLRLAAWVLDAWPELAVDVVIGPSAGTRKELEVLAAGNPQLALHVDPLFMAPLMTEADLAIGAIGTTTWERCALGLPSIALILADNQLANAKALTDTGAGIARSGTIGRDELMADLADLFADGPRRIAMAKAAASLCDGLGVSRLANAVMGEAREKDHLVRIRPAAASDAALIWSWRNEAAARAMSLTAEPIAWLSHRDYYSRVLADTERHSVLIGEAGGRPFGMVRFDQIEAGPWRVSVTLAPASRGLGLGRILLGEACERFETERAGATVLRAEIKPSNSASLSIFRSNAFVLQTEDAGVQIFERVTPSHPHFSEDRS